MPAQQPMSAVDADIEHRFGFHRATFPEGYNPADAGVDPLINHIGKSTVDGQRNTAADHACIRQSFMDQAKLLVRLVPEGRERALMLTALQEAAMWANAGVAMRAPLIKE